MALKDILNVPDIYDREWSTEKFAEMSAEEVLNLWGDIRELNGQAIMADKVDRRLREIMRGINEIEIKCWGETTLPWSAKTTIKEILHELKDLLWGEDTPF